LNGSQTALGSAINSPTTAEALADNGVTSTQAKPSRQRVTMARLIRLQLLHAGTVTAVSTSTVTVVATGVHQNAIQGPVEHAIDRLKATNDPAQMEKAMALREANKPGGLKGALHPDAVEYDVDKTITAGLTMGAFVGLGTSLTGPGAVLIVAYIIALLTDSITYIKSAF
jgi:hypothetical protein